MPYHATYSGKSYTRACKMTSGITLSFFRPELLYEDFVDTAFWDEEMGPFYIFDRLNYMEHLS